MQIHVARPPAQLGVFSQEEVAAGLQSGRFLPSDQGWREGMAAWLPLSQWQEFQGFAASVPASPVAASAAAAPSQVPWEQGKSVGSFFATVKAAVFSPRETFAHARMGLGAWLVFLYVALALVLPFRIMEDFTLNDAYEQLARFVEGFHNPKFADALEGLRSQAQAEANGQKDILIEILGTCVGVAIAPLFVAGWGAIIWVAAWVCRLKVDFERTVTATLLGYALVVLLLSPLALLGFINIVLALGLICLAFVPCCFVYLRAQAGAMQRGAWAVLGANALAMFGLCGCFLCGSGVLGALASRFR
jgi:hypothetical protein